MTEDKNAVIVEPKAIGDLKTKMRLEGVVKSAEIIGVLVDIGIGQDGLVHLSEFNQYSGDVSKNELDVGQTITVWVKKIDEKSGQISLTLKEPLALEWNDLKYNIISQINDHYLQGNNVIIGKKKEKLDL